MSFYSYYAFLIGLNLFVVVLWSWSVVADKMASISCAADMSLQDVYQELGNEHVHTYFYIYNSSTIYSLLFGF